MGETISDEDLCIANAVQTYSIQRPRQLQKSITDSGTTFALATLVSGWKADLNQVAEVRSGTPPLPLPDGSWMVYQDGDGASQLYIAAGSAPYVMTYFAPHVVSDTTDTISDQSESDFYAVAHLAASYILGDAANYFARMAQSTIGADSVAYGSLHQSHGSRAGAELAEFKRHMGLRPGRTGYIVNWQSRGALNRPTLFRRPG